MNDSLFRGAAPTPSDVANLHRDLGIKKVISLDERIGDIIAPICEQLGINHIIIPIHSGDLSSIKHLLRLNLRELLNDEMPTFAHCLHGADRTGLLIALYRCLLDGWSSKEALMEAKYLGFGVRLSLPIERAYTKLIQRSAPNDTDKNDADIVSEMQDYSGQYRDYTLDKEEQVSFSPYGDSSMRKFPEAFVNRYYTDSPEQTRENYGLEEPERPTTSNAVPDVGVYDQNTQTTNIVGPSVVGGGFI